MITPSRPLRQLRAPCGSSLNPASFRSRDFAALSLSLKFPGSFQFRWTLEVPSVNLFLPGWCSPFFYFVSICAKNLCQSVENLKCGMSPYLSLSVQRICAYLWNKPEYPGDTDPHYNRKARQGFPPLKRCANLCYNLC